MGKSNEHYIQVPLNEHGLYAFHHTEGLEDVKTFVFNTQETNFLMSLFMQFNIEFNLFIDTYEMETLGVEYLERAIELTNTFASDNVFNQFMPTIQRVKEALLLAQKQQMPLIFDF